MRHGGVGQLGRIPANADTVPNDYELSERSNASTLGNLLRWCPPRVASEAPRTGRQAHPVFPYGCRGELVLGQKLPWPSSVGQGLEPHQADAPSRPLNGRGGILDAIGKFP